MQNISIKRVDCPAHQGVIEPEDGSWRIYIGKNGLPQTLVRVKFKADDGTVQDGYIDVLEAPDIPLSELIDSVFDGKLSPEEEQEAAAEYAERLERRYGNTG